MNMKTEMRLCKYTAQILCSICSLAYLKGKSDVFLFHSLKGSLYQNLFFACLSLLICLFVSNKRQNGWTDPAHIFVGPNVYGLSEF